MYRLMENIAIAGSISGNVPYCSVTEGYLAGYSSKQVQHFLTSYFIVESVLKRAEHE